MRALTIGEVARRAGVGVETIRFYERRGLIAQPPRPSGSGFRVYPDDTARRIEFIQHAQEIGFSLREIDELLSLRADPAADCSEVRKRAVGKREEVRRKIGRLKQIGAALETLIAACPGRGALGACSILDALVDSAEQPVANAKVRGQRQANEEAARRAEGRPSGPWTRRSAR